MADFEFKAKEYERQADRATFAWGLLGSKGDPAELYENAANSYKLAKSWDEAGRTYVKLAGIHLKSDNRYGAASAYASAGSCFKKTQIKEAIKNLNCAVGQFLELGRLSMAARYLKDIGEAYENDGNIEDSAKSYEQAADLYDGEEQSSLANTCRLKVAHFAAELYEYEKAMEIFETVAARSLDNHLLKFGTKGHLLNAGICHIARGDPISLMNALGKYQDLDPAFEGTRESKLLMDIAEAMDKVDVAAYTDAVIEYDSLSRLDQWKTTLLLRAKQALKEKDEQEDVDMC
eukprot:TRINITY_DN22873_c0_g1_i1.p1 TRINITY_DN22873_c0_g1~~TRINITY_DN22873_c0_g1_i1.p1  ORF type:complete len:290 (+),score=68.51 TRINITY_DN22873_c0_g1_i1:316-1185(+)